MGYIGTGLALCIASQCTNHTGLALCIDTSLHDINTITYKVAPITVHNYKTENNEKDWMISCSASAMHTVTEDWNVGSKMLASKKLAFSIIFSVRKWLKKYSRCSDSILFPTSPLSGQLCWKDIVVCCRCASDEWWWPQASHGYQAFELWREEMVRSPCKNNLFTFLIPTKNFSSWSY